MHTSLSISIRYFIFRYKIQSGRLDVKRNLVILVTADNSGEEKMDERAGGTAPAPCLDRNPVIWDYSVQFSGKNEIEADK